MSVHTVNISEAEGHLAELAEMASQGTEVIITMNSGEHLKLVVERDEQSARIAGLHEGKGWISDDFNEPLDELFGLGGDKE